MTLLENMQLLVGKTIKAIDDSTVNCKTVTCTDGTVVLLEAENVFSSIGLIGITPYLVKEGE